MKYILEGKKNSLKLANYNIKIKGLSVKGNKGNGYEESLVTIIDPVMIENFINKKVSSRIDKILNFMMSILEDPDSSDSDAEMALDEASKLKGILFNKYKEYMKLEDYKNFLSKIFVIEEEFKRNYNQKMFINRINYINNVSSYGYEEEMATGRGR